MSKKEVGIIIPMFNEELIIIEVLKELKQVRPNDTIIIVDDGSSDNSYDVVKKQISDVYLLKHSVNLGQGAALQTGIDFAKKLNIDYLITFDSDGQHSPMDIQPFIDKAKEGDFGIILGSRFLGEAVNMSKFKHYFLKVSIYFTWLTSGIRLTDSHNGFRLINLRKHSNFEMTHNGMSHASEIIDLIHINKMSYIEMPCKIIYSDYSKLKGQSMFNSINIVLDVLFGKVSK